MSVLCDVCHIKPAQTTCPMCGRRVCSSCMTEQGVCVLCLGGRWIPK